MPAPYYVVSRPSLTRNRFAGSVERSEIEPCRRPHRRLACLILSSFCDPNRLLAPRNFRVLYAAQQFSTVVAEAVIGDRFGAKTRRYLDRLYLEILATREGLSASLDMVDTIERSGL